MPTERRAKIKELAIIESMGKDKPAITPGREYVVYGISSGRGNIWYYIEDDDRADYPVFDLGLFFDITDARVSAAWEFRLNDEYDFQLWPPLWFERDFLDRITDGEEDLVSRYSLLRHQMDSEASRPHR